MRDTSYDLPDDLVTIPLLYNPSESSRTTTKEPDREREGVNMVCTGSKTENKDLLLPKHELADHTSHSMVKSITQSLTRDQPT